MYKRQEITVAALAFSLFRNYDTNVYKCKRQVNIPPSNYFGKFPVFYEGLVLLPLSSFSEHTHIREHCTSALTTQRKRQDAMARYIFHIYCTFRVWFRPTNSCLLREKRTSKEAKRSKRRIGGYRVRQFCIVFSL